MFRLKKVTVPAAPAAPITVGVVTLAPATRRVCVDGWVVHLPAGETAVLRALMAAPGRVHSPADLLGATEVTPSAVRSVRRRVRRLSTRLRVHPLAPSLIERVGSDGHRFMLIDVHDAGAT